jgi:hypothetical protein
MFYQTAAFIPLAIRKKYMSSFLKAGATSPSTAKDLDLLGVRKNPVFYSLLRRGIVIHAGNEKYYLEVDRMKEFNRLSITIMISVILIVIILSIIFILKS